MDQERRIPAVVQDEIRSFAVRPLKNAVGVLPVFFERLALLGEDGGALGGQRRSGMVLRREDIAAGPAHLGAQCLQGFDQHRGLDGHVQAAGDTRPLERFASGVFFADGHETGHFVLGDSNLLTAPVG